MKQFWQLTSRAFLGGVVLTVALMAGIAQAAPISVITVDITPFVSPGGPTNTMGMALTAADTGGLFAITEVTPAAFRAMGAAALSGFDLIAINNHPVRIDDATLLGIGTTWQSVVGVNSGGRVILNSHDAPRFHMNRPTPGGPLFTGFEHFGVVALVRQAALWTGGVPGRTGFLVFNDAAPFQGVGGAGWGNAALNLPVAWGITDVNPWVNGGVIVDGGYTSIVTGNPAAAAYAGLTTARFALATIGSFSANQGDGSFHTIFGGFNGAILTPAETLINGGIGDVGGLLGSSNDFPSAGANGTAITLVRGASAVIPLPAAAWIGMSLLTSMGVVSFVRRRTCKG